jgi:Ala-tRNA(Pro) deacylase
MEKAAPARVPGHDCAKVVICFVDGEPVEAVLPATSVVNLARLLELAGGTEIRLAQEDEARPALGAPYGQAVFVDVSLAAESEIVFRAGTHVDAVSMRWADFAKAVKPIVGNFAEAARDRVARFRLSYRE